MPVHIVTSDRGWILERYAAEIASRVPRVTYGLKPDAGAAIQYYITYNARQDRVSPVELALFTHLEPAPDVHRKFFSVAHAVDHCVCMSDMYRRILVADGVAKIGVINPGVDTDRFVPKLKIGVVGRTYATGRKGEHLIAAMMDIPQIEWHFTGSGWPGPAQHIAEPDMPAFYQAMDYILVASLYEGGPMCVPEALACGTPVIAPPVGWVEQFPHISFELGNAASLRAVLLDLVAQKDALRQSVLSQTWDAWAEQHDRLFHSLAPSRTGIGPTGGDGALDIGMIVPRDELSTLGGPSTRLPQIAAALRARATVGHLTFPYADAASYDVLHYYNSHPVAALDAFEKATRGGPAARLCSPIFLNDEHWDLWHERLFKIFIDNDDPAIIDALLEQLRSESMRRPTGFPRDPSHAPGVHARIAAALSQFDRLVCLSDDERDRLVRLGLDRDTMSLVHNFAPVDMTDADPDLFRREHGLHDYILCVGRIELRKNQLMIAHSLRDTDLPIVLIGHAPNTNYTQLFNAVRDHDLLVVPRLERGSAMLRSAFAGARVFCLPSWAEGASIATLEAGAMGCPLVLSDTSSEREYYGEYARYAHPADPVGLKRALLDAWEEGADARLRRERADYVRGTFTIERHIQELTAAYDLAVSQGSGRSRSALQPPPAA